jgi:hypothetical protein
MPRKRFTNPKHMIMGEEPNATLVNIDSPIYSSLFRNALNWYSVDQSKNDARKYLREYVRKNKIYDIKEFDAIPDNKIITTYGWIARLLSRGAKLSDNHVKRFVDYLDSIKDSPDKNTLSNKVNIQESMQQKVYNYIGELEGVLDSIVKNKDYSSSFNIEADLKSKEIPYAYTSQILTWAKRKLKELVEVLESKCPQLKEGYSNFSKNELKNFAKFIADMIQAVEKYADYRKANRKPRQVKPRSAAQQTKNLKYKVKSEELGISSVLPIEIIGAQQLWLYNAKTRKLMNYRTDSALGLQIKGQTIQNYDSEISNQKTLRKPAEQLKNLLSAGKIQLRKFLDEIKTESQSVNGRINSETMVLKAIK